MFETMWPFLRVVWNQNSFNKRISCNYCTCRCSQATLQRPPRKQRGWSGCGKVSKLVAWLPANVGQSILGARGVLLHRSSICDLHVLAIVEFKHRVRGKNWTLISFTIHVILKRILIEKITKHILFIVTWNIITVRCENGRKHSAKSTLFLCRLQFAASIVITSLWRALAISTVVERCLSD